jgi:hypothetical protein
VSAVAISSVAFEKQTPSTPTREVVDLAAEALFCGCRNEHLTWPRELSVPLELAKRLFDFRPSVVLFSGGQAGKHLMQRAKRFLLEL